MLEVQICSWYIAVPFGTSQTFLICNKRLASVDLFVRHPTAIMAAGELFSDQLRNFIVSILWASNTHIHASLNYFDYNDSCH